MFCHKFSKVGLKDIDWCPRLRESLYIWGTKSNTLEITWVTLTSFRWEELLTCEAILDTMKLNIHSCIFTPCFCREQILSSVLVITFNLSLGSTHSYVWAKSGAILCPADLWIHIADLLSFYYPFLSFFLFFLHMLPQESPVWLNAPTLFLHLWPNFPGFSSKRIFSVQMWPHFSSDPDMDKYRKVFKPKAPDAQLSVWGGVLATKNLRGFHPWACGKFGDLIHKRGAL